MKGLVVMGLTPRSRQAVRRKQAVEREKRLERIVTNISEYQYLKNQADQAREAEKTTRIAMTQTAKMYERTQRFIEKIQHTRDAEHGDFKQQVLALLDDQADDEEADLDLGDLDLDDAKQTLRERRGQREEVTP